MAKSSLLWIESDLIRGLLDGLSGVPNATARGSVGASVAPGSSHPVAASMGPAESSSAGDGMPGAVSAEAATSNAVSGPTSTLPGGISWDELTGLAGAGFDRVGVALIERLLAEPDVGEAFLADNDGLLLLGDEEEVALPVVAAELTGRWHSLRRQLDIGEDPGLVSVRLDARSRLDAVAVPTGSNQLRILAWTIISSPAAGE